MQDEIRSFLPEEFKDVEQFKEFKEKGQLKSTDMVAEEILSIVSNKRAFPAAIDRL
jgi:hypothetical protein